MKHVTAYDRYPRFSSLIAAKAETSKVAFTIILFYASPTFSEYSGKL